MVFDQRRRRCLALAYSDLDIWPPEYDQVISRGYWIVTVSFIKIAQAVYEISW